MLKINNFNTNASNQVKYVSAPSFKGNIPETKKPEEKKEVVQTEITPDYNVKKPIAYKKLYDVELPYDMKAHYYKLANGQKVVIVPREGATVLKTYVNTGSMNEKDNIRGISHYLEHNFFNGSDGLEKGDFFKKVDKMGAYTNASTGTAETNYFIKSNLLGEKDLEEQMKIHASMLQTPKFALEMLEKEKDIVNSEINMITSDPVNIGLNRMVKNLYGIKTNSVDLIGGTTDNIDNISREDVINYYNQNYYPANMTTIITGDVKPEETIELVAKYFTSDKQPQQDRYFENLSELENPVREDIISDKTKATTVLMGFQGPSADNVEDDIKLTALDFILADLSSSRLSEKLKKYNTSLVIDEERISSKRGTPLTKIFTTQANEEDSEKVLKTVYNEIENLKVNPPTEEELATAKKQMRRLYGAVFETSSGTNDYIGEALANSDFRAVTDFEKIVDKITTKDLSDVAKKYYDLNKVSITVVHPKSSTEESLLKNHNSAKNISFGSAKRVFNEENVKSYVLPNNIQVVTNNVKGSRGDMVFTIALPNSERPSKDVGSALILSRLLNQGTQSKSRQELATELDKNGMSATFSASTNAIGVSAEYDVEDTQKAFDVMREVFSNPNFTEKEFKQSKEHIIQTLTLAQKSVNDKLYPELFKDEQAGLTKDEIIDSVKKATLDDVKTLYNDIVSKSQADLVVSAPFEQKGELRNIIFENASIYPNFRKFEYSLHDNFKPTETTKVLTNTYHGNQAKIVEAYKFKVSGNLRDNVAITLMNNILGGGASSRLFTDLREERKLAYAVKSGIDKVDNTGVMKLSIGTTTENAETGEISYDNVQKAINGFNENIERMKSEKVSEEELESAKLALKNSMLNSTERNTGKTSILANGLNSFYGLTNANQKFAIIDSITVDDIQNATNYVFNSKPTYSILATENTLNENKEFLKNLTQN